MIRQFHRNLIFVFAFCNNFYCSHYYYFSDIPVKKNLHNVKFGKSEAGKLAWFCLRNSWNSFALNLIYIYI